MCGVCSLASDKVVSLIADFMSVCLCWTEVLPQALELHNPTFSVVVIDHTQRSNDHLNLPFLDLQI